MALSKLKLLITLARIDGDVAERERNYIINIGKANGIDAARVTSLFHSDHEIIVPSGLTDEQRFDYIFSLVQLMKIDERLYADEIRYCAQVASRLGYSQSVMFELLLHTHSAMTEHEMNSLRKLAAKYLQPG